MKLGGTITLNWILVFHLFGVILWLGGLLTVTSMMALVPAEVGAARERLIGASNRILRMSGHAGAAIAILFGILALVVAPYLLTQPWLHVKLALVAVLLFFHIRLARRLNRLERDRTEATSGEFRMVHGIISLLLLFILIMVLVKPSF
ncbi:MAG TPA: CopD family protein [Candidatus Binataceae bacterium]|nr:CopD family protein [Candidatus Binataceae bacterium]